MEPMSDGTSNPIVISGESLSARKNPVFSPVEGVSMTAYGKQVEVKPPVVNEDNVSEAVYQNRNCFPEFVFEKIGTPEYGVSDKAIARFTGIPVNTPDFLNDYYFIGLMRTVDKLTSPSYRGKIINIYDTPAPKS